MRKGEATRQRIIAEAAPIFNQRGFDGCSMQDLMTATGLEKGGLYRHFANKEDLAAEAFRYALAQNVKVRTEHLDEIPNSINKLKRVVQLFVELPSAIPGGCPLMNTAIDADDGNEALRDLARYIDPTVVPSNPWGAIEDRKGLLEHFDGGPRFHDLPQIHHQHAIAKQPHHGKIVRHE